MTSENPRAAAREETLESPEKRKSMSIWTLFVKPKLELTVGTPVTPEKIISTRKIPHAHSNLFLLLLFWKSGAERPICMSYHCCVELIDNQPPANDYSISHQRNIREKVEKVSVFISPQKVEFLSVDFL